MAYIGNTVQNQGFAPAVDYFNGDGTTVTFTLSRPVASVAQLTAVIENVIQNPSTAFTVSGSSITFTSAPPSGTNNIWVEYTSLITTYAAISQDPTVIGDITATGGYSSTGDYGNSFVDGVILDYVTGNARITTGASDGITLYNGGTSSRSALMAITSAGNVGIGTSSPSYKLDIVGSAARIANAGTANFATRNSTAGVNWEWGVDGSGNGFVYTAQSSSLVFSNSTTERMRIDSSGRVTTPYQTAFSVVDAGSGSLTAGTVIQFQAGGSAQINFDVGSTWNSSTDRFTAPISGKYYFSFAIYIQNCNAATQSIAPCVNGGQISTIADTFMFYGGIISSADNMVTSAFILNLAAGDYVDLRVRLGSNTITYYAHHSWFQGFLIG